MKKFDLEAAKAGAPIITRDGREAKFLAHVSEACNAQKVLALIGNVIFTYFEDGQVAKFQGVASSIDASYDLFMKPRKRTVWVNIIKPQITGHQVGAEIHAQAYMNESIARNTAQFTGRVLALAVPVEIEE